MLKKLKLNEVSEASLADYINKYCSEFKLVCSEKSVLVRSLLKRAGLDYEDLSNYRPVYNLSFISKLIEEAILFELVEFFEMIILFPC